MSLVDKARRRRKREVRVTERLRAIANAAFPKPVAHRSTRNHFKRLKEQLQGGK